MCRLFFFLRRSNKGCSNYLNKGGKITKFIPGGYRESANGSFLPEDQIKLINQLRDELVHSIIEKHKYRAKP
ncbi:DUF3164 family protein [Agarivorans sp. B2Z047]|uniref:DUF3164 family protein n=1 Tax=Agarivorans sp. B2Z047 TaxID=2652721 RepID=UPI001D14FFFE|nr:DUF3164 family protein [Agarivorans sp. B2Z047]UQN43731.1 DUF3164 family protein [Agarivorans sp. B2Z047]